MFLSDLQTFDERLKNKNIYVVSLGASEQHGPFAPIGTDNFIQEALLREVEKSLTEVIFLPHIPIGPSWQQLGFHGSISLRESTLYAIIDDIVGCLHEQARAILFVSWHGGNKPVIRQYLAEKAVDYSDIVLDQVTFGDEGTDELVEKLLDGLPDDHAGNTEVALMLALRPDITTQPLPTDTKLTSQNFEWDRRIIEVKQDGIIDEHPAWAATPAVGKELVTIYADNLIQKIRRFL